MKASEIIYLVNKTKRMVLIRNRKEDHVKGFAFEYDVKESPYKGDKDGWIILDLFTASAMLTVYQALSPEHQAKWDLIHFNKLVDFTWSHVK